MPALDLTGQVFGRLTVIRQNGKDNNNKIMWLCQCSCGTEKIVRGSDLRSGKVLSCGCLRQEKIKNTLKQKAILKQDNPSFYKDLTGLQFGRLTVIGFNKAITIQKRKELDNRFSYWDCQCDCGNIITTCSVNLTSGKTQSCGCLAKEVSTKNMQKIQPLGAKAKLQDLTGQYFNEILVLSRYKENTSYNRPKWVCKCHCGNIFITSGQALKSGDVQSCGCLGKSIGEHKIQRILSENSILFKREVKFEDLKDDNYLRFDFAIMNDNETIVKLIEFDGRQHFDKTSIWYTDKVILHDQMKNEYCKKHNIPLLRISYTDIDKINLDYLLNNTSLSI